MGLQEGIKTSKRRYMVMEVAADLPRPPANGAINGSWWRRVRARAGGGE
jgi:hypothetical protein